MMNEITVLNSRGMIIEKIKINKPLVNYILYRGKLLVADHRLVTGNNYTEQPYLELY